MNNSAIDSIQVSFAPLKKCILLVEDDPEYRRLAADKLQRVGYEVEVAAETLTALSRHEENKFV